MNKYARFRYQPCLPLGKDGKRVTASKEHAALSRRAASEGMVLLKNENNALPLSKNEKVALFGKATIEYIKGGGGSGDVHCPYVVNIYDGFKNKNAAIYEPVSDFYKKYVEKEQKNVITKEEIDAAWYIVNNMDFCQKRDDMTYETFDRMHVKEAPVSRELIKTAGENADTAVFVISRFSAEGVDRRPQGGDYYLSDLEKDILKQLGESFEKVIVVINSGGPVDCEYLENNESVKAILFGWQGGNAIADILFGDVNPSGKLVDTFAKSYDYYPSKDDFNECFEYVNYSEDIYVGYRYFETVPGKAEQVRYPFGYGLSYTTFNLSKPVVTECDGEIVVVCTVENTGDVAGKEIVQVYASAPQGLLGKPSKVLCGFKKTKLLAPKEKETVAITFPVHTFASFDDLGKVQKSAYILEKGEYKFFVGTSIRNVTEAEFKYILNDNVVTEQCSDWCKPFKLPKRMLADGTFEELPMGEEHYFYGINEPVQSKAPEKEVMFDEVGISISLDDFIAQFTLEELMDFVGGKEPTGVANTGCFGGMKRLGIPPIPTADGPAGLRLNTETGIPTTAWPCATLIGCTWDPDLAYEVGAGGGAELRENNIGIWLAPALNIHRNPLCGRNFEYLSEDPIISGKVCAAQMRGIQSQKAAVSMKHFACNNKEANRFGCDSRLSERALREIYLKGFEICVKEADPWTVMSSYNLINGQHTSESYELLTGILRDEWGFKNMVETDWGVKNDPVKEVKAGNDMKMHVGYPEDLMEGYNAGEITRADLELCVKRILEMTLKMAE